MTKFDSITQKFVDAFKGKPEAWEAPKATKADRGPIKIRITAEK